jgi:hypothetical protein
MSGNSNHHAPHHLPDFTAEDIETFLGGVLSSHHSHPHPHPHPLPHALNAHPHYLHLHHHGGGIGGDESADGTGSEVPGGASDLNSTGGGDLHHDHDQHGDSLAGDAAGLDGTGVSEEVKAAVRTERKRCREKQRRSDVNRQFTELSTALRKVETESTDWARHTYTSTTNRADLIARSIYILNAIHEANESRKRRVVELERDLEQAKKAGEETAAKLKDQMMAPQQMGGGKMVMMVPMMIGGDSGPTPAMTMPYGQMPFYIPQQPAAAIAAAGGGDGSSHVNNNHNAMAAMAMPPYMMQHMMVASAAAQQQQQQQQQQQHQQQQSMMQHNPLVVMGTTGTTTASTGMATGTGAGAASANGGQGGSGAADLVVATAMADHGKKKAATSTPDYTNNVAHLA